MITLLEPHHFIDNQGNNICPPATPSFYPNLLLVYHQEHYLLDSTFGPGVRGVSSPAALAFKRSPSSVARLIPNLLRDPARPTLGIYTYFLPILGALDLFACARTFLDPNLSKYWNTSDHVGLVWWQRCAKAEGCSQRCHPRSAATVGYATEEGKASGKPDIRARCAGQEKRHREQDR